ncbi:hypothetical protein CRUP_035121, partial [Coryphaenoides rupestris]
MRKTALPPPPPPVGPEAGPPRAEHPGLPEASLSLSRTLGDFTAPGLRRDSPQTWGSVENKESLGRHNIVRNN